MGTLLLLTNEYPPNVYGGAGVHVEHLCRELTALDGWRHDLRVLCFGDPESVGDAPGVKAIGKAPAGLANLKQAKLLDALHRNLAMVGTAEKADIIHCHTWYSYLAGCLLKPILDAALVITVHSLEPHRPWKKEQLGSGYHATCWLEKTALQNADLIIAVSSAMKQDLIDLYRIDPGRIRVIYNGIDTRRFSPVDQPDIPAAYGIDSSRPYVLFVGRIARQKGILHLVNALPMLAEGVQAVLCAGAPDTKEIAESMQKKVAEARRRTSNPVLWIDRMIPPQDLPALYRHASVFVCPSIYEPFGIINLEAMACGTPVVAASVGGIPEVVDDGETGLLVPFEASKDGTAEPARPDLYSRDLAAAVNVLLHSEQKREAMGRKARKRVEDHFGWNRIAEQTLKCYDTVLNERLIR